MDFQSYLNYFKQIIDNPHPPAPYNDPLYIDYTKLNWSRMNRWLKTGVISRDVEDIIKKNSRLQNWIIITEPWCGDAAHLVPFMELLSRLNPQVKVDYELRDAAPFRIDHYLTHGSKSIPMLIVQDENGKDLFHWGPRPTEAQSLYLGLVDKKADFEETKVVLQNWYNKDKGQSIQEELKRLLASVLK